jgi:YVTN family beta-propeller protein
MVIVLPARRAPSEQGVVLVALSKVEVRRTVARREFVLSLAFALVAMLASVGVAAGTAGASSRPSSRSSNVRAAPTGRWLQGSRFPGHRGGGGVTVPVGESAFNAALDPSTHTVYVSNFGGNTVSLIDAATCNAQRTAGCRQTVATVQVGEGPTGLGVDQATDTIYVANFYSSTVSVINGATCNAQNTSGCSQSPPTVTVGNGDDALDVNQKADTVYVANAGNGTGAPGYGLGTTVSVIDGATCNGMVTSGCGQTPPTVTVATGPDGVVVDQSTDTVYAGSEAPNGAGTVSVIDGATCNATITSGCTQTPPTVTVGTGNINVNVALAIDATTKTLYVANSIGDTLSMINTAACNAMVPSGCGQRPKVDRVGNEPIGLSLDGATGTIYVAHEEDDTVSVLDAATCNATVTSGCGSLRGLLRTGGGPYWVTTDQATDSIYVPDNNDGTVSVLNGATCNAIVTAGCVRFFLPTVEVGTSPVAAAVDQTTDTVYVPNANDDTVSVVNGGTCNADVTSGCDQSTPAVTVGAAPFGAAIDGETHTLYVANLGDNTVSVIDAATCNAVVTSGCGQAPATVAVGNGPDGLAVDQTTDTVYVANFNDNTVSVIDGATCNAIVTSGCGQTPPTVTVGDGPGIPDVNDATDTVYVPNYFDNTVSVIDGVKCNATVTSGCGQAPPTVTVGNNPEAVAVDPSTHTAYVVNINSSGNYSGSVSVVNAATCNAEVSSGCRQTPSTVAVGALPQTLTIDQATDVVFVANYFDASVSVIDGATCNATLTIGCARTLATIPVGGLPYGPAVNEATRTVYVPNSADNNMSVFGFGCPTTSARTPSPR